jgi:hypothetical protein
MASTRANALIKINDFDKRSSGTDWLLVKKDDLVRGLKDRIATPNHVDTSAVNLCGPGAFFRCLAMDDPVMYVTAVIALFETNSAVIGARKFTASYSLRIATPASEMDSVDWVPLASLRDDENTILNYDDAGGGLSGLTMPAAMEKWFQQAGYGSIKNVTNIFFTKDLDNIKEADRLRAAGYRVCLLINADMLRSATQNHQSVFPNHWVCLTDAIKVDKDDFTTKVHSWGAIMPVPAVGTMKVDVFLKNYYGYVAAKPF